MTHNTKIAWFSIFVVINPAVATAEVGPPVLPGTVYPIAEVFGNPTPQTARRHWVMDQIRAFKAGETMDFYGVKVTWVAAMSPESIKAYLKGPYEPLQIHRATR